MLKLHQLREVGFFSDLPDGEIERLTSFAKLIHYPKDALVIRNRELTASLYIIADGILKVRRMREDGREVILSILKSGDIFGEMAFINHNPRSADVVTITPATLVVMDKTDFNVSMEDNKAFTLKVIKTLVKRLSVADTMIERLALESVYERLVHFIREQSEVEPETGRVVIKEWMPQMEVAAIIGSSREMVSKIMRELIDGGFLAKEGKDLIINKKLPASW